MQSTISFPISNLIVMREDSQQPLSQIAIIHALLGVINSYVSHSSSMFSSNHLHVVGNCRLHCFVKVVWMSQQRVHHQRQSA